MWEIKERAFDGKYSQPTVPCFHAARCIIWWPCSSQAVDQSAAALRLTSAHQASRWTGGFAAVARALSGMSNVQCDSLDSATTDVLARARLRHDPFSHQARPCRLLRIRMATTFAAMGCLPIAATPFSVHGTSCGIASERLCSADTAAREHFCFEAEMWRAVASLLLLIK